MQHADQDLYHPHFETDEEATGHAIKQSGIDRKDIFLTSKLWNSFHGDNVEMVSIETGSHH